MCCDSAVMMPITARITRIMGTIQVGRSAISRKVFEGSKKTPTIRENSPILEGSGSTAAAFSGVILRQIVQHLERRALGYHGDSMRRYAPLVFLSIVLCSCKPTEESHMKAIVGAVLIDGLGGPPLSDSVVVVAGSHIREVGPFSAVQIPADADKVDGSGKFLVPGLIDVYPQAAAGDDAFTRSEEHTSEL